MGASESTAKTNGAEDDKEKNQQEAGGSSVGSTMALAAAGVAAVGVAAWSISKKLSENNDRQQIEGRHGMESLLANSSKILEGRANSSQMLEGAGAKRSSWSPPPMDRLKINTDGGCHSIHGRPYEDPQDLPDYRVQRMPSGYGGILRDHRGNWVRGFRGYIGVTDCLTAELHGIHKGLELLDKHGYQGAILESDSQAAVEWVNGKDKNNPSKSKIIRDSWSIIVECRRLAQKNNTTINLIKGNNANQCADKLADLAIAKEDKYVDILELPYEIKHLVDEDAIGYRYPAGPSNALAY